MLLGIDIGGTTIKVGLILPSGKILARETIDTPKDISPKNARDIAETIQTLVDEKGANQIEAIGITVPGIVDAQNNVRMAPNVNLNLPALLQALQINFPLAVLAVLNDANAAALGEQKFGAGEHTNHMVFITLGTGVGGGIIVDGNLVLGRCGATGEIGHITVDEDGESCGCGRQGCLELYCSSRGVVKLYKKAYEEAADSTDKALTFQHDAEAKPVFDAARAGDAVATAALEDMTRYLASALATMACILDCEAFVIGGGLSASFDLLEPSLTAHYQSMTLPAQVDTPIRKAQLGNDAGMLGAAIYALEKTLADA